MAAVEVLPVKVVRKAAGNVLDPDVVQPVAVQDPAGRLRPGEPPCGILGRIFLKGTVHPGAANHGEDHRRHNQNEVGNIEIVGQGSSSFRAPWAP